MSESTLGRTDVAVRPLRFTDNVAQVRDFLVLLGFSPMKSRAEAWIELAGAAGMVALHSAASATSDIEPGDVGLGFEVLDADALQAELADAGLTDSEIIDEAWGRVVNVRDKDGRQLTIDERSDDPYGYEVGTPEPRNGIVSMPLHFESPTGPTGSFLPAMGFVRLDEGDDEWWRVWRGQGGGLIALHPPTDDAPLGSSRFGFRTREPLRQLAERLIAAGHTETTLSDDFGGELTVIDPDGQRVLVQPVADA